jgi:hypothetical protein
MDPPPITVMDFAVALGDQVQIDALKDFQDGKMDYATMRGLCG